MIGPACIHGRAGFVVIDEYAFDFGREYAFDFGRPVLLPQRPVVLFRHDQANHCPGCQGSAWHVGRASAECAGCGEVIPFFSPSPN